MHSNFSGQKIAISADHVAPCVRTYELGKLANKLATRARYIHVAKYPFDEKFNKTVRDLSDWDGDAWNFLINYDDSSVYKALAEQGYPAETVSEYVTTLLNQPVFELVDLTLADNLDGSPALLVLQRSAERDVFDSAIALCQSTVAKERELGVLVLMRAPGRTYHDEAVEAVIKLVDVETDDRVMAALAYAYKHLEVDDCSAFLVRAAASQESATRLAAAYGLGGLFDEIAIESMIALSRDPDDDVRDWATFGLHNGLEGELRDRQDIRDAFFDRLTDSYDDTRYEAFEGLALCKDDRVLEPLSALFETEDFWCTALEAAKEMAHPALLPSLTALKEWWHCPDHHHLLDEAIVSCMQKSEA